MERCRRDPFDRWTHFDRRLHSQKRKKWRVCKDFVEIPSVDRQTRLDRRLFALSQTKMAAMEITRRDPSHRQAHLDRRVIFHKQ